MYRQALRTQVNEELTVEVSQLTFTTNTGSRKVFCVVQTPPGTWLQKLGRSIWKEQNPTFKNLARFKSV